MQAWPLTGPRFPQPPPCPAHTLPPPFTLSPTTLPPTTHQYLPNPQEAKAPAKAAAKRKPSQTATAGADDGTPDADGPAAGSKAKRAKAGPKGQKPGDESSDLLELQIPRGVEKEKKAAPAKAAKAAAAVPAKPLFNVDSSVSAPAAVPNESAGESCLHV